MPANLQYLQRHQIDINKWDHCIDTAANGLIYGYSWYLDHMARHWDALVWNDYDAVMPLTWNRKWGISYLYQPPFTQQLGLFAKGAVTNKLASAFLHELPARFRFAAIFLNYAHANDQGEPRSNFILPLNKPYDEIWKGYKNDLVKNLKRTAQFNLHYETKVDANLVLTAYRKLYGSRTPHVTQEDYARFKQVCTSAGAIRLVVRGVTENGQLLSAALLLSGNNRLYLLHSVTWPEGRDKEANHFLLDRLIHEFAGTNTILDFEGSDIPGIAAFYKNFGSIDQPYFYYRYNRLPRIIKWLKR